MRQINGLRDGLDVFKALGSSVRMRIVELLAARGRMNLNEIAGALGLTNGALTSHIRKLEEAGIIHVSAEAAGRGSQKLCSLGIDQLLLSVGKPQEKQNIKVYETEIRVGHYSDYSVKAGCGIATKDKCVGGIDDPRAFAYPERLEAELIWFHDGYVEYRIPNLLPAGQRIVQLTMSLEIASALCGEAQDAGTRIEFYLNGGKVGEWFSFTDRDNTKGIYTPPWWNRRAGQHGFLKMLVMNRSGTYLDGRKISDVSPADWKLDDRSELRFRFQTAKDDGGDGIALFGSGFGNYNQDIMVRIHSMPEEVSGKREEAPEEPETE